MPKVGAAVPSHRVWSSQRGDARHDHAAEADGQPGFEVVEGQDQICLVTSSFITKSRAALARSAARPEPRSHSSKGGVA
jgi:hypothetical protein